MRFSTLIAVFAIIFTLAVCSALFGQYQFDSWNTDNGLPQNGVRGISQTPDGYLWFTTFDGLVRFDGVRFTTFNKGNTKGIINNRFSSINVDAAGVLYATTTEDGVLTILKDGEFISYDSQRVPGHYIKSMKPDANNEIRYLTEDDDRTTESWYYLRNGQFVLIETMSKTNAVLNYQANSGANWKVSETEVVEFREGNSTAYEKPPGKVDQNLPVFEDSTGGLWVGGFSLTYFRNGETQNFGNESTFPEIANFHSFWEEPDGSVWFANGGGTGAGTGLVRFKDGKFESFGAESGLSNSALFDVFKDREGTIWIATNKGLNRLKKKVITAFSVADGLNSSEVYPILRDKNDAIWIGTTFGLNVFKDGKFSSISLKRSPGSVLDYTSWRDREMSVQSLFEDTSGKMWVGVSGGIFVVENGVAEFLRTSEGHHTFDILEDRSGDVWAATSRGLLKFQNYKLAAAYDTSNGLPNEFMTAIFEDSTGRIFFGGLGGLTEFVEGKFRNYGDSEGFRPAHIRSFHEDSQGTIWIGTYDEGLVRFKNGQFVGFKVRDGLFNNGVFAIREDAKNNFWISSNRGIYRVNRNELNDFADGKIREVNSVAYGKADGMLSSECNGGRHPASIEDKDGNFWFPTQEGVVLVDPGAMEPFNILPPPVVIESVSVEREQVGFRNGITIEAGKRNIEIDYTGLSLIKSEQLKFKYKLEGHDPEWIDAGSRRSAYYSYLPPGNYKFRVIAANSDGVWNETGSSTDLRLEPFIYQTNLFYIMVAIAVALLLFLGWKISVIRIQAREKRLVTLVAERTKELKKANENLEYLANSDSLTNVANRRRFEEFLSDEWSRAVRFGNEISMIMIDIDHFKLYNDTYGHQAGDECLRKVAEALKQTINRPTDLVARFGGEEFAVILGVTDTIGTLQVAENAMECIRNLRIPHASSKSGEFLTVSMGVATTFAKSGLTVTDLIKAADNALYFAKENGRNQIKTFDLATPPVPDFLVNERS